MPPKYMPSGSGGGIPLPRSKNSGPSQGGKSAAAAASSTAEGDQTSFSASGSSNVVQWLAAKAQQSQVVTTGGAVEWLKAQRGTTTGRKQQASRDPEAGLPAAKDVPKAAAPPAAAATASTTVSGGVDLAAWAKAAGVEVTVASAPAATAATVAPAAKASTAEPTEAAAPPAAAGSLKPLPRSQQQGGGPAPAATPTGAHTVVPQNRKVRPSRQAQQQGGERQQQSLEIKVGTTSVGATAAAAASAAAQQLQQQQAEQQQQLASNPAYQQYVKQQQDLSAAHIQARQRLLNALANQESAAAAVAAGRQLQRLDLPAIVDCIEGHDVTIICTDTGSGKSTSIPNALLDHNPANRIVTTQPRRTATISIAQHVAQLREQLVGEEVGYWIRGERRGKETTRLWYMTSYTLLLQLLGTPLKPPYTHIILDEFHERQPDIEVTAALLKLCLEKKTAPFKLILMSATLNVDDWVEYFKGLSVAVYRQSAPEHPIHDFFLEDAAALVGMQAAPPPQFLPPVVDQHQVDAAMFATQHVVMALNSMAKPDQSMVVFLPGRAQVEEFVIWAETVMYRSAEPIAWHSAVDLGQIQDSINRRSAGHRQKIYFATDIAEVSITLPDVVFVIDTCLVKRPSISPHEPATILYPPLNMQYISQGSIAQRRGRVGRTQQGFYFALISVGLVPLLPRLPSAPVQNSRIDELALHSLQLASNPVAVFSVCRAQPLIQSIITSMRSLTEYGCIVNMKDPVAIGEGVKEMFDVEHGWSPLILSGARSVLNGEEDGEDAVIDEYGCTFIGRLLQLIPVSMQQGLMVFYGFLTGLESLMILAAAAANSLMPFSVHPKVMQEAAQQRSTGRTGGGPPGARKSQRNGENMARAMEATEDAMKMSGRATMSDLIAVMDAALRFRIQQLMPGATETSLMMWCAANSLAYDKILAIVELDQHIKYELSGFIPFRDLDDPVVLLQQLHQFSDVVVSIKCAAFASQAQQVVTMGGQKHFARESAMGLFTELKAMPDLHSPSSFRWELDDIIVPICINLRYSHTLVSYSTLVKSSKRFYLSLLLFAHRLKYDCFADDDGKYYEFAVTFHGRTRYLETDQETGAAILDFRQRLSRVCTTIRLRYSHKDESEPYFDQYTLGQFRIPPLYVQQREVIVALMHYFFGPTSEGMQLTEVEHSGDSELTSDSMLAFRLPAAA